MVLASIAVIGKETQRSFHSIPCARGIAVNPRLCPVHFARVQVAARMASQHNPLYIRAFSRSQQDQSEESLLRFHFIVHTALDFVEDKIAAQRNAAQGSSSSSGPKLDPYLGLLYPIEDLRVYGYASTSKVKFIAVLDDEDVKDAQMNAFFRRLHGLYVDTVCNPFHPPNTELYDCAKFQRQVDRLVDAGLY